MRVDKVTGAVLSYDTSLDILVPAWIAVGASSMVWSNCLSGSGSVASCPVTGCGGNAPKVLAPVADRPNGVVVDGDTLYWAESNAGTVNAAKVEPSADTAATRTVPPPATTRTVRHPSTGTKKPGPSVYDDRR